MRRWSGRATVTGLGLALVHFAASYVAAFGAGVGGGVGWKAASAVLTFPLTFIPDRWIPADGLVGWLPWAALSLAWGFGLVVVFRRWRRPD